MLSNNQNEPRSENPYEPPSLAPPGNERRSVLELGWYVARGAVYGGLIAFAVGSFLVPLFEWWFGGTFGEFYFSYGRGKILLTQANSAWGLTTVGAIIGLIDWCLNRGLRWGGKT